MRNIEHDVYRALMGQAPEQIPHWEHWSDPDAETVITGIDYWKHPKACRAKLREMYPELRLPPIEWEGEIRRPAADDVGNHTVRWGDNQTATFLHGEQFFQDEDDVFAFSPLEHADMREWPHVVENWDFSSVESCERRFGHEPGTPWEKAKPGEPSMVSFYNSTFMWPMLTFGWEMFMSCCLDERFERIMDEFAELNRRAFTVLCRMPANFLLCHDDIVTTRGPVCSPEWMHKYVFPRYEEYFGMAKAAGKEVIFMADGCVDQYADDVFACGARGIISEPYTNYKAIAKKHKDCFLAGEGDNRILSRNDPAEIRAMVERMVETSRLTGGYMMCIGNHIPWNVPGDAIRRYLDLSRELATR